MLKTKSKILLALFLVLILVSSYCFATEEPAVDGQVISEEDTATISETEGENETNSEEDVRASWTNDDLYIFQDKVELSNVIDGNVFIIANEVNVTGEVGGDLFVIANKLNINGGYIYSNLFACANEITINGVVYDVYATCDTLNLESNGYIYRDIRINASTINMSGKVRRNAYVSAKNMNFTENDENIIYGSLHYSSKTQFNIPENAIIGEITYTSDGISTNSNIINTILHYIFNLFKTLLFTFVITIVLMWLTPKFVERIGKMKVKKSFVSLGIGILTPIAVALVAFLLIITSIGTSILASSIFAFVILALIGSSITSIFFGKLFTRIFKMEGKVKFVLLTLASNSILWALTQIPFVGMILSLIITIFGIGTVIVNMIQRKEKIEETSDANE